MVFPYISTLGPSYDALLEGRSGQSPVEIELARAVKREASERVGRLEGCKETFNCVRGRRDWAVEWKLIRCLQGMCRTGWKPPGAGQPAPARGTSYVIPLHPCYTRSFGGKPIYFGMSITA